MSVSVTRRAKLARPTEMVAAVAKLQTHRTAWDEDLFSPEFAALSTIKSSAVDVVVQIFLRLNARATSETIFGPVHRVLCLVAVQKVWKL